MVMTMVMTNVDDIKGIQLMIEINLTPLPLYKCLYCKEELHSNCIF